MKQIIELSFDGKNCETVSVSSQSGSVEKTYRILVILHSTLRTQPE